MHDFLQGFVHGARETPRGFFAPAVAAWLLITKLMDVTESLLHARPNKDNSAVGQLHG